MRAFVYTGLSLLTRKVTLVAVSLPTEDASNSFGFFDCISARYSACASASSISVLIDLTCSALHAHFGGLGYRGDGVRDHSG